MKRAAWIMLGGLIALASAAWFWRLPKIGIGDFCA